MLKLMVSLGVNESKDGRIATKSFGSYSSQSKHNLKFRGHVIVKLVAPGKGLYLSRRRSQG